VFPGTPVLRFSAKLNISGLTGPAVPLNLLSPVSPPGAGLDASKGDGASPGNSPCGTLGVGLAPGAILGVTGDPATGVGATIGLGVPTGCAIGCLRTVGGGAGIYGVNRPRPAGVRRT